MRQLRLLAATLVVANISIMPAIAAELPTLLIPDAKALTVRLQPADTSASRRPEPRPDLAKRLRRWQTGGPVYLWNQEAVAALINRQQGNLPAFAGARVAARYTLRRGSGRRDGEDAELVLSRHSNRDEHGGLCGALGARAGRDRAVSSAC